MARKLHIHMDRERMLDLVTVDEVIGVQEGSIKHIRSVLSRFVLDDTTGDWMSPEEGTALIGQLTLRQLIEAGQEFSRKAEGTAVPPESGKA